MFIETLRFNDSFCGNQKCHLIKSALFKDCVLFQFPGQKSEPSERMGTLGGGGLQSSIFWQISYPYSNRGEEGGRGRLWLVLTKIFNIPTPLKSKVRMLKVSKLQKDFLKFSFVPKNFFFVFLP